MRIPIVSLLLALTLSCGLPAEDPERFDDDNCRSIPSVRTESESCCPEYGEDACGAGLFCAAFDGRKVPTCYALYSQVGLAECGEDKHCANRSCNAETGKCRSGYLIEPCDIDTGCTEHYACQSACPGYSSACSSSCQVACEDRCIP